METSKKDLEKPLYYSKTIELKEILNETSNLF